VDTVVRGCTLAAAAVLTQQAAPVYQLAMSDCNPFTFAQVVDLNGIAVRRYQRKHGSTPVERFFAFTDGVNGSWAGRGAHTLSALKRISRRVRDTLSEMDAAHIPQPIQLLMGSNTETTLKNARKTANNTSKQISRIQGLLDLYKPFIWDTQWVFKTDNIRDLSSQLSLEDQAAHAFDGAEICWRNYWVNVEYPGLATWCFPLLNGETVASDPAPTHPVVLDMGVSSKLDRTG